MKLIDLLEAPADTPWLEVLCRYYAFFVKEDSVRVILFRYTEAHDVVALEKHDGVVQAEVFKDAYTAFHATISHGYERVGGGLNYERFAELMERSKLTPEEIHAALV